MINTIKYYTNHINSYLRELHIFRFAKTRTEVVKYYIYFLLSIIAISCFYNILQIIALPTQGAHLWRQADGLAMVWNYKLFNLPFLQVETFNLLSIEGKGIAEFPIFYYFAAQFANPEKALRTIHFVVLIIGFFAFYRLSIFYLKNNFYAITSLLLFASSPLIIFYGINFIVDVPAFCFALLAWSIFLINKNNKYRLLISFGILSFASLLKAVYALNFLVFIYLLYKYRQLTFKTIFILIVFISIPSVWVFYAKWYNAIYQNDYLFLGIKSIFSMSMHNIGLAVWRIVVSWSKSYFWRPTSIILLLSLFYFLRKRENSDLSKMIIYTLLMNILYIILFLDKLIIHEYYYPFFYIQVAFVLLAFFKILQQNKHQNYIKIGLVIFVFINLYYCKNYTAEKQTVQRIDQKLFSDGFQSFLNQNGCTISKTIFCYDDLSVNQSLYAIKRKGITQYNENWQEFILQKKINFILVSEQSSDKIIKSVYPKNIYTYKNYKLIAL